MNTIINHRDDGVYFSFDNGFEVSTIWSTYSYSDNYDNNRGLPIEKMFSKHEDGSTTVEVYFTRIPKGGERFYKGLLKKYNNGDEQPFNRLPINDWFDIINKAKKWKNIIKEGK